MVTALTVSGDAVACSFFTLSAREPAPITLSRAPRDLATTWEADAGLARIRAYHAAPPEPCNSCPLFSVCRGGCQIVSRRVAPGSPGSFAPDPECPRVTAAAAP